ncbi:MAG: aldo/keto reductase [Candidatus Omnitrophica bacterium]|nr:aldo/keto reductase [Candidatus Omnitrophota bacterium]
MNYRRLGRTGLKVSEIGFGCWAIGGTSYGPTKDEDSLLALETAWNAGVNFFDTADTYGHGHSEELLARFLKGKPRDKVVLASKVGWDFYHGGSKKNFSPDYIEFACEQSLKRLGVETLDLYQLHNPKLELIQQGEVWGVLEKLKTSGKIRYIGVSIHREEEGLAVMEDGCVDTLQLVFNLIEQDHAERVFPAAKENDIGILAREPLACGLLSGKYSPEHQFLKTDHRNRWTQEKRTLDYEKIERLRAILATDRLSMVQAALEYILQFDAVSTVIPGAKTKEQVLENLKATLDPKLRIQEADHLRGMYQREEIFSKRIG